MTEQTSNPPLRFTARACRPAGIGRPDDILRHAGLSIAEKRAILADWASDAHTLPDRPAWRQLDDGSVVQVDEILEALRALDAGTSLPDTMQRPVRRGRGKFMDGWRRAFHFRDDDDDDPPPCPASAARPLRLSDLIEQAA